MGNLSPYGLNQKLLELVGSHFSEIVGYQDFIDHCIDLFKQINSIILSDESGKNIRFNEDKHLQVGELLNLAMSLPQSYFRKPADLYFAIGNSDISEKDILQKFAKFAQIYFKTYTLTHFLLFTWDPPISSGEYSHLTFYSRLFAKRNQLLKESNSKGLIVFLDEVEITLHPILQKRLVYDTIAFFEVCFPNQAVQIIYATHSPILLSDIPTCNTIFLKRFRNSVKVIKSDLQTFGANIYALYKHPFFMGDGLIGNLAQKKIDIVLDLMKKEYLSISEFDYCFSHVTNIGDDLLRSSLLQELNRKSPTSRKVAMLEQEVQIIQEKIRSLRENDSN